MKVYYTQVRFRNSERKYCYKTFLRLKKGDIVLVGSSNGVGLAEVMEPNVTDEKIQKFATAYVLDYIDLDELKATLKKYIENER